MAELFAIFSQLDQTYTEVFRSMMRYVVPFLAFILLWRCAKPLLTFRKEPEVWGWLCTEDDRKLPITHWENVIGSGKNSDIMINASQVSKNHAVLTRYDDGSWTITDADSQTGIKVNGKKRKIAVLEPDDVVQIGGISLAWRPISRKQENRLAELRTSAARPFSGLFSLLILSVFQALCAVSYFLNLEPQQSVHVFWGFAGICLTQWLLWGFYLAIRKSSFEIETMAFFLCTLGMMAIATVKPGESVKQLISMVLGVCLYLSVGWSVRDLERAKKVRRLAALLGILLLVVTLVFGKSYHGAKNWLMIGGLSLQPSELSKVCFVFVGASTMDRILNKQNLILFIAYTLVICGCLAVMNDFGTALIFFVAFLIIAYLRSGSVGTIALACTSLGFAGVIALKIAPHALRRFTNWRHIWEDYLGAGYQQTRGLMCIASGGLFGLGAGQGWMHRVFAADSDIVFATLSEEWGLILCVIAVVCILVLGLFAMRCSSMERSSFYVIAACTAAGILLVQTIFNVLGTLDVLPLTGVTFPLVSNGGSSMIGTWGLLAFIKAADTRQNASFAVRQSKEGIDE